MSGVDWEAVKLQYELFGQGVVELAKFYNTTQQLIRYAIDEGGWVRAELPVVKVEELDERLSTINKLKRSALNPAYAALETSILSKAQEIINDLETSNPTSAMIVKQLTDVLNSLGKREDEKNNVDKGVTVRIMNQFSEGGSGNRISEAIEVKIDGGDVALRQGGDAPQSAGSAEHF